MRVNRSILIAAYLLTAMLLLVPFLEVFFTNMPVRPASLTWRFAALGALSRALMTPLLALLIMVALGAAFGHQRALRLSAALSTVLALVVVFSLFRFLLDLATLRAGAAPDARVALASASLPVIIKMLLSLPIASLTAFGAWQMDVRSREKKRGSPTRADRHTTAEFHKATAAQS